MSDQIHPVHIEEIRRLAQRIRFGEIREHGDSRFLRDLADALEREDK